MISRKAFSIFSFEVELSSISFSAKTLELSSTKGSFNIAKACKGVHTIYNLEEAMMK